MPTEEISFFTRYEVEGEDKVIRANRDMERSADKVTKAMKDEGKAAGLTAKQVATLASALVITTKIARSVAREFQEAALTVFENTEEYEGLAQAVDEVKGAFVLFLLPAEETKAILDDTATAVRSLTQDILRASAIVLAYGDTSESVIPIILNLGRSFLAAGLNAEEFNAKFAALEEARLGAGGVAEFAAAFEARFASQSKALEDATTEQDKATDSARKYERAVESLARTMRKAAAAQAEFAARQDEITQGAAADRIQAATDRFSGLAEVESDLRAEIADVNRDANRAVERADKQHQRSLTRIAKDGAREQAKAIAQERLREQFDGRRFDLSVLQNERLFLAERSRLAAQGDVLAIDELDERRALEREIEKENFDLQEQRQAAMFKLQLDFQKQAAQVQADILTEALGEQLRAIEANRQERIGEAKDAAEEDRMQVKGEFVLEIAAIDAQEKLKLAELEKGWDERLATEADKLAALRDQYDLTTGEIMNIWRLRFGQGGELDQIMQAAILRRAAELRAVRAALGGLGTVTTAGGRVIPTRYRAHGGDEIVSSPTMFMAGEGGPERVITQPLSSIGGAMTVRWQGGAIPLEGRGGLENLDLAPVGQALAQGLTTSIMQAFLRQRGNWGR